MEMLEIFGYRTVAAVHFTDQKWIPKTRLLHQVCDETQKSNFRVRPWSSLTILNFSERGPTDKPVF